MAERGKEKGSESEMIKLEGVYIRQHVGSIESLEFRPKNRVIYRREMTGSSRVHKLRGLLSWDIPPPSCATSSSSSTQSSPSFFRIVDTDGVPILETDLLSFHSFWLKQDTITSEIFDD